MAFRFNQITLDPGQYRLSRAGKQIPIEPRAFDLLVYLVENRNRVVTRNELLDNLWKGKVVTDSALGASLKDARKAIGDSGSQQKMIKTVHGRGYQFIAQVSESTDDSPVADMVPGSGELLELPEKPSVAVLPFTNMSGDPEQEFFADGLTDELITGLSKVPGLFVIANNSTMTYKGRAVDVKLVAREQGVRFVLEGAIRKSGDKIRVSAQLIDGLSGHHLWAERYESEIEDIFSVQDDISHRVVVELQAKLVTGDRSRPWATGTSNLRAWELVSNVKSRIEKHVREETMIAKPMVLEALELDPNYSAAWCLLGWILWEEAAWGWVDDSEKSMQKAADAARKSLAIDPPYPGGYGLMGYVHHYLGEVEAAIEVSEKGVEIAPSDSGLLALLGNLLVETGRFGEGIKKLHRAIRLCPFPPSWYLTSLGLGYHLDGDNEAAIPTLKRAAMQEPDSLYSWLYLVSALVETGASSEMGEIVKKVLDIEPGLSTGDFANKWLGSLDESNRQRVLGNFATAGLPA